MLLRSPASHVLRILAKIDQACDACRLGRRRCDAIESSDPAVCSQCQKDGATCHWSVPPRPPSRLHACDACRIARRCCSGLQKVQNRICEYCAEHNMACAWEDVDYAHDSYRRQKPDTSGAMADLAEGALPGTAIPPARTKAIFSGVASRSSASIVKAPITGQLFETQEAFEAAIEAHSSSVNPGSKLAHTEADDIRFRAACLRPECTYNFNAVKTGMASEPDQVMVRKVS